VVVTHKAGGSPPAVSLSFHFLAHGLAHGFASSAGTDPCAKSEKESNMDRPTPTQEENDRAAEGKDVTQHAPDGSPPDTGVHPPEPETKRRQVEPEAQRPGEGYQTRDMRSGQHGQHGRSAPKRSDDDK
jgi:hypothetical protein